MSVVSNKFDAGVKELASNMFNGFLPVAIGESEQVKPKPNPSGVFKALELTNFFPKSPYFFILIK